MGSITIISIVPKSGNIVWYRRIHSKINLAITVIPIAVRRRVKYEQKSRHRYHVYANLLDKIDEQDVTANIRPLSSLLSHILPHLNIHPQSVLALGTRAIRFHLFPFGDPCSLYFPDTPNAYCAASIFYVSSLIIDISSFRAHCVRFSRPCLPL